MTDTSTGTNAVTVLPPEDEAAVVPLRYRFDGWTPARQRQFLRALGDTGCIRDACRAVKMSKTSAYRLRALSDAFARAWDRALDMAATVLEQAAFERAVTGIEEPVWRYGKQVGTRRRFSDSLLALLIQRGDLRGGAAAIPVKPAEVDPPAKKPLSQQEVDAMLLARLDALAARKRQAAIAEAERLRAAGLAP